MTSFEHSLHGRFLRGLALSANSPAIRSGGREVTYAEAHATALTWAGNLLRSGSGAHRAIGVLAGKGTDAYLGILAALYCGVPVVPLQPDFPAGRIRQTLAAARVSALVTDERGYRMLPEVLAPRDASTMPVLLADSGGLGLGLGFGLAGPGGRVGFGRAVAADPRHALAEPRPASPDDAAYILFTSGSTGRPKGVVVTHGNLRHYFQVIDARYDFGPGDVFSQVFDPSFDCSIFDLFGAWGCGGTVVSVPGRAYTAMPEFLAAQGITVWYSTPAAISVLAHRGALADDALPTLRLSMFAGDALTAASAAAWQRAAPRSILDNLYGPTETTITCSAYRWSATASPAECRNGIVPIGRLHEAHDYVLLDERGQLDPEEGELCVRGPQVTPGYLDPADDEGRFVEYAGLRWYRTGDRARLAPGGDLLFLGRTDNQVQVGGWRVELGEIDHHVRQFDGVKDAVTVSAAVDGRPELVVFYTGAQARPADFARHLLRSLPQQMVPRHYRHLDEIPLSPNRKFDRRALRALAAEPRQQGRHDQSKEKVLR